MTVNVSKPALNVREKLAELDKPTGIAGEAMLRAETPQEQFNLIGAGRRNFIINGNVNVHQRGDQTAVTAGGTYGPDRWRWALGGGTGFAVDLEQSTDAADGFEHSLKVTVSSPRTSTSSDEYTGITTLLEVQDAYPLLWNNPLSSFTLSFWVKSSIATTYIINFNPDDTNSGGSGERVLYHALYTINTPNTWEYKTVTVNTGFLKSYALKSSYVSENVGLEVSFVLEVTSGGVRDNAVLGWNNPSTEARNMVTSSDGADTGFMDTDAATWQITGVQLELGKVATPFEHRSYGEELALCQRYYYKHAENVNQYVGVGWVYSPTTVYLNVDFPVTMRTTPTAEYSNTSGAYTFYVNGSGSSVDTFSNGNGTDTGMTLINSTTVSGFTTGTAGGWYAPNGLVAFDAEL